MADNFQWQSFFEVLQEHQIKPLEPCTHGIYVTDAGGLDVLQPKAVLKPITVAQVATILAVAQQYVIPITCRGGGLTTEGESLSYQAVILDMTGMAKLVAVNKADLQITVEAGIFWHCLAEQLRPYALDYISAPLNMTSTVGGTLGVGGVDINSFKYGLSADQVLALEVVTPTGEIKQCSEDNNTDLFNSVLLGYGQFGVITKATLQVRHFQPIKLIYRYYSDLNHAVNDLKTVVEHQICDYCGLLTIDDDAIIMMIAFDSDECEYQFKSMAQKLKLTGYGEFRFIVTKFLYFLCRPWRLGQAFYLFQRRLQIFPQLFRKEFFEQGKIVDRTVLYSRAVWKIWGGQKMVIPDISVNAEKLNQAVLRGNAVTKQFFHHYTLYIVGIRLFAHHERYAMSCVPPDAENFAFGCEFDPDLNTADFSNKAFLQSYKNTIYDIGLSLNSSFYRFGGGMKRYIRKAFSEEVVAAQFQRKQQLDPNLILNNDVIF